jgi:farnesyl diphosphate synthase
MIKTLAKAIGFQGMVGGQALDITYEKQSASLSILRQIHRRKTGALIFASVQLAALTAGCQDPAILAQLKCYADNMGLAYQIQDDLLDIEGSLEQLGKTPGQDVTLNKATFPALLGVQSAKEQVKQLYQEALNALETIFDLELHLPLKQLSEFLIYRTY